MYMYNYYFIFVLDSPDTSIDTSVDSSPESTSDT